MTGMEGFTKALRAAMAEELCIDPADIVDVRVEWDDGDRYDPTYGDLGNVTPTFKVVVTTKAVGLARDRADTEVSIDFVFTALLRLCLGVS